MITMVQGAELLHEHGIIDGASGRWAAPPDPIRATGDADALLTQDGACRLDPVALGSHLIDEADD
ncbi:hypothetical protein GCM10025780_29280 [Frondihabitans cladoniiphilus]|uniref:DUF222 domain-containing protein n=1 Tax=Frondihabitans cladoniiphilus TaxID=715785 RepID=A0ABP8W904_9MICO